MAEVTRPIVRSFQARFVREAARHVRGGGHAVVWDAPSSARLVVTKPDKDNESDLGRWSMLDLGRWRYTIVKTGALKGLAFMRVPRDCLDIVRHRAERDSILPGPTRNVSFDCLACGACCRDNRVILEKVDLERFRRANREDLAKKPYARREKDGRIVLVLRQDKRCKHLARDNRCDIYELRPDSCSTFPVASECCLFAREDELGLVDGLGAS